MKTLKTIAGLMFITSLYSCSDEAAHEKVWRIKSIHGAGDSKSTINLKYNKANAVVSVERITDGIDIVYHPSRVGKSIILNYESTSGAAERTFTFDADSTLLSVYEGNSTDVNRKFFYDNLGRMGGYYRSKENGDTSSLNEFIWSGNEIPGLRSFGYTDGVRDMEYELVNMTSEEVVQHTYVQFPVELSAVLFDQEEFLLYGLANPAKFQIRAERTIYSNLEFDDFGHWTGYTRNSSGAGNQNVTIIWEQATINN